MDDRRGTEARFVGEDAAGDAGAEGAADENAENPAVYRLEGESIGKDKAKRPRQPVKVQEQHRTSPSNIQPADHRNQKPGGGRHPPLPAPEDEEGRQPQKKPANDLRQAESGVEGISGGVCLGHVAGTEGSADTAESKNPGGDRADVPGDIPHRAGRIPLPPAVGSEEDFAVLESHPAESRHPHPENRPRPARRQGGRDPGDVAGAEAPGEGGRRRAEGGDLLAIRGTASSEEAAEGGEQAALGEKVQIDA